MPLGREVGLGPGHIVFDVDQPPCPQNGHRLPIFGPRLLWPNGRPSQLSTCLIIISVSQSHSKFRRQYMHIDVAVHYYA